ncbi:MAG: PAS domain S-box protein [Candidatus Omnitrophota bacterium]
MNTKKAIFPKKRQGPKWAVLLLVIFVAGMSFTWWTVEQADREMRINLLRQTQRLSQALELERVRMLSGTKADTGLPGYLQIKEQFAAIRLVNPTCRFVYLLGRKSDGKICFFLDSEPVGSKDGFQAGQNYEGATSELLRVFDKHEPVVRGPVSDPRGTWVSGFVPITDPKTDELIAVLGMDMDALAWKRNRFLTGVPLFLLTLVLMGNVIVFGWMRSRKERKRSIDVAAIIAVGLTLTLGAAWLAHTKESRDYRDTFSQFAQSQAARITEVFHKLSQTELEALARFFENKPRVSNNEYQEFAYFLTRNPDVQAWEWIPAVPEEDLENLKQEVLREGLSGFEIWQINEEGKRIPASGRRIYYPVLYITPLPGNERALGYDLGSEAVRFEAIQEAERTRLVTGTNAVMLVQGEGRQKGMLVYRPVFERDGTKHLQGFSLAVLRFKTLLETATASKAEPSFANIDLFQLHAGEPDEELATTRNSTGRRTMSFSFSVSYPILAFGKAFLLTASSSSVFDSLHPVRAGWIVALAGFALTLLLAFGFAMLTSHREELATLVIKRTDALQQVTDRLTLAAQAGGVGIWDYDVVNNKLVWDDQMYHLYGITKSQFGGAYEAWQAGVHPDDRQRGHDEIQQSLRGEKDFNTQFRVLWPSGEIRDIRALAIVQRNASGDPLRMIGTNWDITEQKRAEEEITRQANMIRSLLDSIPDIIFFKDLQGVYLGCNPSFVEFAGRPREEIIGKTDDELFGKKIADFFREHDKRMLAAGEPLHNEEWITYPDGRRILIDTLKTPYRGSDGSLIGVLGISRDITARKCAEDALRESEANFRTFFESMTDLIIVGTPDGKIIFTNIAVARTLGYSAEELAGMHVVDVHSLEMRGEAGVIFEAMLKGERKSCNLPLSRKDGSLVPVETRVWLGRWNGEDCIFGVSKNLTAEMEAQQRFERLFHNNPALMALSLFPEQSFSDVNDAFLAALGYSRNDVIGKTLVDIGLFVLPEQQNEVKKKLEAEGRIHGTEIQVRCKNGKILDGLFSGEVITSQGRKYFLMVIIDITERKTAENLLKFREASLLSIIENQPGLVWLKDIEGRFLVANKAFAKSCGHQRPEWLVGKTDFEVWPKELAEKYRADDEEVVASAKSFTTEEQICDAGEYKWFETFKTPIFDADGHVIGTTGYSHDITERRQMTDALQKAYEGSENKVRERTQELRDAQEQMIRAEKLAAIGKLASSVAHELRNPLGVIKNVVYYLRMLAPAATHPELSENLDTISQEIEGSNKIISDLLEFSRVKKPALRPENINRIIKDTLPRLAIGSGSEVLTEFYETLHWFCT